MKYKRHMISLIICCVHKEWQIITIVSVFNAILDAFSRPSCYGESFLLPITSLQLDRKRVEYYNERLNNHETRLFKTKTI